MLSNYPQVSVYYRLFAINSWSVCCGVGWAVFFVLATPYFALYGVSPFWTAFATASGPVSGLLQPVFGLLSDMSMNSWGRRRPWILAGIAVALFGMILFPTAQYFGMISKDPETTRAITVTLAVVALWFYNIGLNMVQVCGFALVVDKVEPADIQIAMTTNSICSSVAGAIANGLGFIDFHAFIPFIKDYEGVFYVGLIIVFIFAIPTLLVSETPAQVPSEPINSSSYATEQSTDQDEFAKLLVNVDTNTTMEDMTATPANTCCSQLAQMVTGIFNMKTIVVLTLIITALTSAAQSPWTYYFTDYMGYDVYRGDPKAPDAKANRLYNDGVRFGSLVMSVWSIVTFVISFFVPKLTNYFGYKAFLLVSLLYGGVGYGFMIWSALATPFCAFWLASITGLFQACGQIVPYALISLSVDASEIGLYMGIINVFQVASQLIANFIASLLMNNYWVNVTLGVLGKISPGIAFGIVYIALAIPVVLLLDVPLSFETDPEEILPEKKLLINTEVLDDSAMST